ncbi:hypothetical protein [Endozoicomonas montiporae]|uniref:hypothetical protein n=1 Tax=Endozoicomonas montiporae TaxID=1027273 RepID=UPI001C9DDB7A|nr:hypothetical protein [Endozoicomonas montiporae]
MFVLISHEIMAMTFNYYDESGDHLYHLSQTFGEYLHLSVHQNAEAENGVTPDWQAFYQFMALHNWMIRIHTSSLSPQHLTIHFPEYHLYTATDRKNSQIIIGVEVRIKNDESLLFQYSELADQLNTDHSTTLPEERIHSSIGTGFSVANVFSNSEVVHEIVEIYNKRATLLQKNKDYEQTLPVVRKIHSNGKRLNVASDLSVSLHIEQNLYNYDQYSLRFSEPVESDEPSIVLIALRPFTVQDKKNEYQCMIKNKNARIKSLQSAVHQKSMTQTSKRKLEFEENSECTSDSIETKLIKVSSKVAKALMKNAARKGLYHLLDTVFRLRLSYRSGKV